MPSTAILLLEATAAWRALSEEERAGIRRRSVSAALREGDVFAFVPTTSPRSRVTDMALVGGEDAEGWLGAYDRLRGSELLETPWLRVVGVLPAAAPAAAALQAGA